MHFQSSEIQTDLQLLSTFTALSGSAVAYRCKRTWKKVAKKSEERVLVRSEWIRLMIWRGLMGLIISFPIHPIARCTVVTSEELKFT